MKKIISRLLFFEFKITTIHDSQFSQTVLMPGVIYIQTVPPFFTVKRLRETMSRFDGLGRVFLQSERRGAQRKKRYTEGWVEFKSKKVAKEVVRLMNGQVVGGRRRSAAYDSVWTMKYLHGFKWEHLMEQLNYEQRIEQQRLRTEIVQEKRKADYFAQQVEKGERLKKLEEKILKKCGLWEKYQRQHKQQKIVGGDEHKLKEDESLLLQIFGGDGKWNDGNANSDTYKEQQLEKNREKFAKSRRSKNNDKTDINEHSFTVFQ